MVLGYICPTIWPNWPGVPGAPLKPTSPFAKSCREVNINIYTRKKLNYYSKQKCCTLSFFFLPGPLHFPEPPANHPSRSSPENTANVQQEHSSQVTIKTTDATYFVKTTILSKKRLLAGFPGSPGGPGLPVWP